MEIKLCYKIYPFRFTLGACKSFYDATGMDLQLVLLKFIKCFQDHKKENLLSRMIALMEVISFNDAAHAIHCLVQTENKNIPLDEIRDGMDRVAWLPSERTDDLSEPWVMVMISIAFQVNEYFMKNQAVKKKATRGKRKKSSK